MIARDTGGGSSFVGAGQYYLHDRNADTDERVAFTHTENLLTDNPEAAIKVMAWTAMHQAELKQAAGVKATGRKLSKPVHTFMFSWAPGEEPDHAHMIETAKSAMAALGLEKHEALYVGHDDTDKRHIHVIVNRVDPDDGRAASLSNSRLKLSKWAEAYEKEHGVHCHRRIENNRRRSRGDNVIDLESRRRNAEHFSDWREKRREEAGRHKEQRRFAEWAERKNSQLSYTREKERARLEGRLSVQKTLAETRLIRRYDISVQKERLAALEASLSVGGVRGVWRRLTGRRGREIASRADIEKTVGEIQDKHREAQQKLKRKLEAARGAFLAQSREQAQALALRIENARQKREREGWRSYKTEKPRSLSNDNEKAAHALRRAIDRERARQGRNGPEMER